MTTCEIHFLNHSINHTYYLNNEEYPYFQALLFFEIFGIASSVIMVCTTCVIGLTFRQFHRNIHGLAGNMAMIFFVLIGSRLFQIGISKLDSRTDVCNYFLSDLYFYFDYARWISLGTYAFLIPSLAIERTLATIKLKQYEDFKNPLFLIITVLVQWFLGAAMTFITNKGYLDLVLWMVFIAILILGSLAWLIFLHFLNLHRHNKRDVYNYNLRERFQLSENIRFLKMIRWCALTIALGDSFVIIVYFWFVMSSRYHHFRLTLFNYAILFNGIALPIVAILTNRVWKREFIKIVKKIKTKVIPWNKDEQAVLNPRFHAPYLITLTGKPMVFNVEKEGELYFAYLNTRF